MLDFDPNDSRCQKARKLVADYFNRHIDPTDNFKITKKDVFVVWFSKTLQHWKALVSTNVSDGMYYEVTYNGDKHESYVDAYKKFKNERVTDEEYDSQNGEEE